MIARIWRGWVRSEDADAYVEYLRGTGIADTAPPLGTGPRTSCVGIRVSGPSSSH